MEDIIINIDSRYRDTTIYSNPSKFRMNFNTTYKNIISLKITSIEINNTISYIDEKKNNNFITLYFPNKLNDDTGYKLPLPTGLYQLITSVTNTLNIYIENDINSSEKLMSLSPEKYFYIFYLNDDIDISFDFPNSLKIYQGWTSVYGLVLQITNHITQQYNYYKSLFTSDPINYSSPSLLNKKSEYYTTFTNLKNEPIYYSSFSNLYNGVFNVNDINLPVYDLRYPNYIRTDKIDGFTFFDNTLDSASNLDSNLINLKTNIYTSYISAYIYGLDNYENYNVTKNGSGILDIVCTINSSRFNYFNPNLNTASNTLRNNLNAYKYFLTNQKYSSTRINKNELLQIYNIKVEIDSLRTKIQIKNEFSLYTFNSHYFDGSKYISSSLTRFLTDINSLQQIIPDFEIDFNTFPDSVNSYVNNQFDIKKLNYETVGYYLGYRKNFYTSSSYNTDKLVEAEKFYNNAGEEYIFIRINDYGYIDFFGQKLFAKVLMMPALGNPYLEDNIISKEYRFPQPINISKFDIEILDYLGNIVDFNGSDYSFTIEMKQVLHSDLKRYFDNKLLTN